MCIENDGFVRETKSLISIAFQHHLTPKKNLKASKKYKNKQSLSRNVQAMRKNHMLENSEKIPRHNSGNFRDTNPVISDKTR